MISSSAEGVLRRAVLKPAPDVAFWARRGGLLFKQARHAASMNQQALASVSGTSRTTLSAYEHGRKSPTLETAGRILDAAGFRLVLEPKVEFTRHVGDDGVAFHVPDVLVRLPVGQALGIVAFRGRRYRLADRGERGRAYAALLCAGAPRELLDHVDGAFLAELWPELELPSWVRAAWRPLIEQVRRAGDFRDV
ncbi:helix-turn-helix transcriptional regulator [Nonomuraea sp. NN258]|uniref:helix-turn-helix transcriptional regulator n=1 Tax=Nonomuraea antri TaxID=2730852 RepID=UPI0015686E39|nr:helix-turn-helix transcriptional regulator [Nonomuraea antri]NRQ30692.1 helix-turn-helix transcriptional regulator [Nonomuraea antri]